MTSFNNNRIKDTAALLKQARARREQDAFVVEGIRMCREIPKGKLVSLYLSEELASRAGGSISEPDPALQDLISYAKSKGEGVLEVVKQDVFERMADTKSPQGILAVVRQFRYEEADLLKQESPLLLALENLQDPGNLGTMFRSGEASGIGGILMSKDTVDVYNPKVIRSTMGSVFRVPFFYTEDFCGSIRQLQSRGIQTCAAHLQGSESYEAYDYKKPTVFIIGNEGNGLTKEATEAAACRLKIPMEGQVESLNAATAATVLLFEAARQRRN
ncbi:MAG: RNA methyltransferase [Lachnospiraceae bacterium]|nr:RNA methyltransferase [Lachnospiraceae bacterium]